MKIQESGEMYLETILVLRNKIGVVRSIDIANETGYSKPSVSRAMGILKDGGFIEVYKDGAIVLTLAGEELAKSIYERHIILTDFFVKIGVNPEIAAEDACKIEHDISEKTFEKIKEYVKKMQCVDIKQNPL